MKPLHDFNIHLTVIDVLANSNSKNGCHFLSSTFNGHVQRICSGFNRFCLFHTDARLHRISKESYDNTREESNGYSDKWRLSTSTCIYSHIAVPYARVSWSCANCVFKEIPNGMYVDLFLFSGCYLCAAVISTIELFCSRPDARHYISALIVFLPRHFSQYSAIAQLVKLIPSDKTKPTYTSSRPKTQNQQQKLNKCPDQLIKLTFSVCS